MRFRGTLVRPLADQADLDGNFIDPAGVEFTNPVTVFVEFDYRNPVGRAVVSRAPDGSLVAEGELGIDKPAGLRIAAGVASLGDLKRTQGGRVISACRLNAIGLTPNHSDPGQPEIEEVP